MAKISRRQIGCLFCSLSALPAAVTDEAVLPSHAYRFEDLPRKVDAQTQTESWQVFRGQTHDGFKIACHMTRLAPDHMPHPPHQHVNEEVLFMHEGKLDVTIAGVTNRIGPGSVAYIHSNEIHGVKNVGTSPAQYFILELEGETKVHG